MPEARNSYAPIPAPRFQVETAPDGSQRIVIPAPRALFPMLFLPVWLIGWTYGGITAAQQMMSHFHPFLAIWLCGWALGEAFALATILWMAAGRETLRVVNGDLEISASLFSFARRRLYRGGDIHGLSAAPSAYNPYGRAAMAIPLVWTPSAGGIKFSYGARTVYAGVGIDETEGAMIVGMLKGRLPKAAA